MPRQTLSVNGPTEPLGHALGAPLHAALDSPRFDNSAVDGYGVRRGDTPGRLRIRDTVGAGDYSGEPLAAGYAVRLLTGAPIPDGVDAVVMQEDCHVSGEVVELPPTEPGANIRRQGEEYRTGDLLVPSGTLVTPSLLGLAAGNGLTELVVRRFPAVSIVSTGNELVLPGSPLPSSGIYESNGAALAAAIRALGGNVRCRVARDDGTDLRASLDESLAESDLLISTGGVSVGDRDLVKETLREMGVREVFWRINMKPGKPVFFGTKGPKLVFGLPGNPVSALVTFQLLVRPAIRKMLGADPQELLLPAELSQPLHKREGRAEFVRSKLENRCGRLVATPTEGQGSHMVAGIAVANALIHLPTGEHDLAAGSLVNVSLLRWSAI